jgi:hypothetical protein
MVARSAIGHWLVQKFAAQLQSNKSHTVNFWANFDQKLKFSVILLSDFNFQLTQDTLRAGGRKLATFLNLPASCRARNTTFEMQWIVIGRLYFLAKLF